MRLEEKLLSKSFSHIYVEEEAKSYPLAKEIMERFKKSEIIEISNYKEVFSRNNQNFALQKAAPKIILAVKKEKFLYPGAKVCESFGNENFYYISSVINCVYDCEYCYLQGVYSSANIVIFVNIEDMFGEVEKELEKKSMYICISYDTDLLAIEGVTGLVKKWYDFCGRYKNLKIELRTKSGNIALFNDLEANPDFIIAWTLSPHEIAKKHESGTPGLEKRVEAAGKLVDSGWTVRICFDPVIYTENFEGVYGKMIEDTFARVDKRRILDISIGTFRISKEYLKRMKKNRGASQILYYPFQCENGVYTYESEKREMMMEFMKNKVLEYVEREKIFV